MVVASGVIWVSLTLVLSLLRGPREPLKLAFFVAVLLRGFYACDDSVMFRIKLPRSAGAYHELAWAGVAQKAAPLLTRLPAGAQPYRVAAEEWFGAVKAARKAGKVQ